MVVAALSGFGGRALGAPPTVGGGFDYYSDTNHQATRTALAQGTATLLGTDLFAAGLRFDNDAIGGGYGWIASAGVPVAPLTQLRVTGTQFIGDGDYRAWRLKAGATLTLLAGPSAGLFYTHEDDRMAPRIDGVLAEGNLSLVHGVGVRATAGYARNADGVGSVLGTVGGSGPMLPHVAWSAELGLTQDRLIAPGESVPHSHRLTEGLPIVGSGGGSGGGATTTRAGSLASLLMGIRVVFP